MYDILKSSYWPVSDSSVIQLYSLATPNGRKVSIALEELGLPYEAHKVNISGDQYREEYLQINPNNKIPTIIDPDGPNGEPFAVMESGAILLYLARKTQKLLPLEPREEGECLQWLFFQMASVGPMFGQFGHFYIYAGDQCESPYPLNRYANEVKRLLGVLDKRLATRRYIMGEQYTICDIALFPWVGCLDWGYHALEYLQFDQYPEVKRWHTECASRPASQRGSLVCGFD